ncbi:Ig-like domain-containing protein [Patescibacteria group bacterium]|nr:Ig-like domain-containing protein [Patescibacteria group bacterium]
MRKVYFALTIVVIFALTQGCSPTNQIKRQVDKLSGSPEVSSVEPADGAKEVALDAQVKITFSQEMNPDTLNAKGAVIAYKNEEMVVFINPFLNSGYNYDTATKTLVITPSQKFLPDQEIVITLTEAVKSAGGKSLPTGGDTAGTERYKFSFKTTKAEGQVTAVVDTESVTASAEEESAFTEAMAKNEAVDFMLTGSETYRFDGQAETLEVTKVNKVGCAGCFDVSLNFTSTYDGYGDRTDQSLSSGDVYHEVIIRFENGEVVETAIDKQWDILKQEIIQN